MRVTCRSSITLRAGIQGVLTSFIFLLLSLAATSIKTYTILVKVAAAGGGGPGELSRRTPEKAVRSHGAASTASSTCPSRSLPKNISVADEEGRDAEHAARDRGRGVVGERLLDRAVCARSSRLRVEARGVDRARSTSGSSSLRPSSHMPSQAHLEIGGPVAQRLRPRRGRASASAS